MAAERPVKSIMHVSTATVKPVLMQYGLSMIPQNTGNGPAPYLDTGWLNYMKQLLNLKYICGSGGSLAIYTNYIAPPGVSRGYNVSQADCDERGVDFNSILHGRAQRDYTFGAFESDLEVCKILNTAYLAVLNPSTPIIDGSIDRPNYNRVNGQIDYIISAAQAKGVKIIAWKIGEETQAVANSDVLPNIDVFKAVTKAVAAYIHSKDASATIIADAKISDDLTCRFDNRAAGQTMNKAMSQMEFITAARNYFQVQKNVGTYPLILTRLLEFENVCDIFYDIDFPGKTMELAQQQFGTLEGTSTGQHPYTDKWGQAIVMGELIIRALLQSMQDRKILFTHSQMQGMVSGTRNTVKPCFYVMQLLQSALVNDGICAVDFQEAVGDEGRFADLLPVAVKRGAAIEIYIRNSADHDVVIPLTRIDAKHKNVTVSGLFAKLDETEAHSWEQPVAGDNAICKALSITKITTEVKAAANTVADT